MATLRTFENRDITRTRDRVLFGCGAVTVAKDDLRTVADFFEKNPKAARYIVTASAVLNQHGNIVTSIESLNVSSVKALSKIISLNNGKTALNAFNRLIVASCSYYTARQISRLSPQTLRDIAGATRGRKPAVKKVK